MYNGYYMPAMYHCRYHWYDEHIQLKAKISRGEQTLILDFLLNGVEYDKFIKMDGTFSGVDTLGKTTVVTLLNTDIITIIESDYEEVKILYDKKCSDDYDSYLAKERERSKAYEEKQKQKKEKQSSAKEIAERIANIKNIEAIEVEGKSEETETQKRRGFWYRLFHRKDEASK